MKQKRFQYASVVMSHDRNSLSYDMVFNRRLQPVLTVTDYRVVPNKESLLQGQKAIERLLKDGIQPTDMMIMHNERAVSRLLHD